MTLYYICLPSQTLIFLGQLSALPPLSDFKFKRTSNLLSQTLVTCIVVIGFAVGSQFFWHLILVLLPFQSVNFISGPCKLTVSLCRFDDIHYLDLIA